MFLAGPPLVKMATGEESDDESLGGAEMHARVSGLADYLAVDERDAHPARPARSSRRLQLAQARPRPDAPRRRAAVRRRGAARHRAAGPAGAVRPARGDRPGRRRLRLRRVQAAVRHERWSPAGRSVHGYPVGILANARGVLFSEEAQKAAQFIQLANQADTPLLFLQNTTGYMVGTEYEQGGIIKHGAHDDQRGVQLARCRTSPSLIGASYGAGNYGMCGRAYDPRFLFAWPNAKSAVMGAGAARRRAVDRGPAGGRGRGAALRRGGRRRSMRTHGRAPDRGRVAAAGPVRAGSTTTASSTPATPAPCSGCACPPSTPRPIAGADGLRRLPDVSRR